MSAHPLVEAVAPVLWETWRTSPIVTDAARDVTWQTLCRWAETNDKMRTMRDTVYAEARAAVLATLRGLRDPSDSMVAAMDALDVESDRYGGGSAPNSVKLETAIDVVIAAIGGPDA